MAENGVVNDLGLSRRSVTGVGGMSALLYLSGSDGNIWLVGGAMVGIVILGALYMIMNEIKDRRNGKGAS